MRKNGSTRRSRATPLALALGFLALAAAPDGLAAQEGEGPPITVTVGDEEKAAVDPGDRITLPVRVDIEAGAAPELAGLEVEVSWDPTVLSFVSGEPGEGGDAPGGLTIDRSRTGQGELSASLDPGPPIEDGAGILTLTLEAGAEEGGAELALDVTGATDRAGGSVLSELAERSLPVCLGIPGFLGDLSGGDGVDVRDAQQVARASVGLDVPNPDRVDTHGDVTGDGETDVLDAQQIARHATGLDTPDSRPEESVTEGCGFRSSEDVQSIEVSPADVTLDAPGATLELETVGTDASGERLDGVQFAFSSSDPSVVDVDGSGVVTARSGGEAVVSAFALSGPASAEARVAVERTTGSARLALFLTDAPEDYIESAVVDIGPVEVVRKDGPPETLVEDAGEFDLLELQDGVKALLADAEIDPGVLLQLRLIVEAAEVTLKEDFSFPDGSRTRALQVPSGAETGIKLNLAGADGDESDEEEVSDGEESELVIDFDVSQSFVIQGNPGTPAGIRGVLFQPVLRAVDGEAAASVSGTVSGPEGVDVEGLTVAAERRSGPPAASAEEEEEEEEDDDSGRVATAETGEDGSYTIRLLAPGSYVVTVEAPEGFETDPAERAVEVEPKAEVTGVDFELMEETSGS